MLLDVIPQSSSVEGSILFFSYVSPMRLCAQALSTLHPFLAEAILDGQVAARTILFKQCPCICSDWRVVFAGANALECTVKHV